MSEAAKGAFEQLRTAYQEEKRAQREVVQEIERRGCSVDDCDTWPALERAFARLNRLREEVLSGEIVGSPSSPLNRLKSAFMAVERWQETGIHTEQESCQMARDVGRLHDLEVELLRWASI